MSESRDRAVVLGASMGGLLAARVLADFYRNVTVVERDCLPDEPANRRGVPQGKHRTRYSAKLWTFLAAYFLACLISWLPMAR